MNSINLSNCQATVYKIVIINALLTFQCYLSGSIDSRSAVSRLICTEDGQETAAHQSPTPVGH